MHKKDKMNLLQEAIRTKCSKNIVSLLDDITLADIEKNDEKTGLNMIHIAASEGAYKELFLILSEYKNVDVNILTNGLQKKTALEIACSKGNVEIVKLLLQNGAKIEDIENFQRKFKEHKSIIEIIESTFGIERKKSFFSFLSKLSKNN